MNAKRVDAHAIYVAGAGVAAATSWLDDSVGENDANAGCANMKVEVKT